jgi:hypothetical protein
MARKVTASAQRELVRALRERYRAGTRQEKARILDEFSSVSGYHRKHAIRHPSREVIVTFETRH